MDDEERYVDEIEQDLASDSDDEPMMDALPDPDEPVEGLEGIPGVCFFCQENGPMWTFEVLDPGGRGQIIHLCEHDAHRTLQYLGMALPEKED